MASATHVDALPRITRGLGAAMVVSAVLVVVFAGWLIGDTARRAEPSLGGFEYFIAACLLGYVVAGAALLTYGTLVRSRKPRLGLGLTLIGSFSIAAPAVSIATMFLFS